MQKDKKLNHPVRLHMQKVAEVKQKVILLMQKDEILKQMGYMRIQRETALKPEIIHMLKAILLKPIQIQPPMLKDTVP